MGKPCLVVLLGLIAMALAKPSGQSGGAGGSKCPGTVCASGPPGQKCEPKYERDNKCCPVWYCRDRTGGITTHYGMSSSHGGSVVQSASSSSGGGGADFHAGMQNMFSNMFGG